MTLQTELNDLKEKVAELEARINAPVSARWKPEEGENYHYWKGEADWTRFESDYPSDLQNYAIGNVFRTKEEAETKCRAIFKRMEIWQKLEDFAGGFVPDWDDIEQDKQCIIYNPKTGQFEIYSWNSWRISPLPQFPTREAAQAAIDAIGVDDLKIMFGVK